MILYSNVKKETLRHVVSPEILFKPSTRQNLAKIDVDVEYFLGHRAQCPSHDGKIKTVPGHKDKVQS